MKQNKYSIVYWDIINRARDRSVKGYKEVHHIIPRCMGGTDNPDNLVELTAREHFICHLLLIKMVEDKFYPKMAYAAWQLSRPSKNKDLKITSRTYESLKHHLSESRKGRKRKPFSEQARANMKAGAVNRKKVTMTEDRLKTIRESVKKRKKLVGELNPFYGKTHSIETIEKVLEVNSRIHVCPHCGKEGASNSMKRWHFDNCISRTPVLRL